MRLKVLNAFLRTANNVTLRSYLVVELSAWTKLLDSYWLFLASLENRPFEDFFRARALIDFFCTPFERSEKQCVLILFKHLIQ